MAKYPISSAGLCDGKLRLLCVSHPEDVKKSDAFIFTLNCHVILLDGGMEGCRDALDRLLALRDEICTEGEKLRVTWILSHMHVDHIVSTIESILPCPDIEITDVYMPPRTKLTGYHGNGDKKYRDRISAALSEFQPGASVHVLEYAAEGGRPVVFDFGGAKITLLPPERDWYEPRQIDIIVNGYYEGEPGPMKVATCVINSSSIWMRVDYAGRKILFTGDSMKRTAEITEESWDMMLETWKDELGSGYDLVKWPHHGMVRDDAAPGMKALDPAAILTTTSVETASARFDADYPGHNIPFYNCCDTDVAFTVAYDGNVGIEKF